MFDLDHFISDCKIALKETVPQTAVREVVERAVSEPGSLIQRLGEPAEAGIQKIYCDDDLTILNVAWAPWMTLLPHNHRMWAVIGIYTGREDNIFWRRIPGAPEGKVEAAGAKALSEKDAVVLGPDIIHSVTNPIPRTTGAIHVYGGDFFRISRSEWDSETLREGPYDVDRLRHRFEEANKRAKIT
jgi:predicted metal-dependent enzyme (double-stranded beta helix superfamily)